MLRVAAGLDLPRPLPEAFTLHRRLSALLFLQYAAPGALLPLYSAHLQRLGFGDLQLAVCCATQGLAYVLAPLVAGQIADRYVPAERCLAAYSFLAGVVLWALAGATSFPVVLALTLAFWLLATPLMLLGTSICLTHLQNPEREFGSVRLWGTLGWMVPGWLLVGREIWPLNLLLTVHGYTDLFRLGAIVSFALAGFAFFLPHTPPKRSVGEPAAPLAALRLLARRPFIVLFVCTFGVCLTQPFTTQATPLLLRQLKVSEDWLGPTLSLAQAGEVLWLMLLPMFLVRLGLKTTLLLGLAGWTAALTMLSIGQPVGLVIGSLGFNGLCVSSFLVAGQVFVNGEARGGVRASLQALHTVVNGCGVLLGHLLVGWLRLQTHNDLPQAFVVAAAISGVLVGLCLVGFQVLRPVKLPVEVSDLSPLNAPAASGAA
jgi:predicted MFS family arabinose efflux permease